ncbi:glycoside hydrolase family 2 TIM barrel-domain containing protein [Pelagicoccus mobilis]|uniref:DUF4982 domain-containing protein n=1 Tax=Pelagicoccus mobilis TaxID=415221 RepID=A0A934VSU0_9BACT|nr:glycoside hydrolase family 2 TIM barrel-domain containing protein [Pelagicoccus mobilis]MBK1879365.1 DUF4982 domain-containing protein [Pelagicoccus mobilis]
MKPVSVFVLLLVFVTSLSAKISIDEGWSFIQRDVQGAEAIDFDDESWRVLGVPHDWSVEGEYAKSNPMGARGGYLPAGIGWYRKTIEVPAEWKGKHVEVAFDGIFRNSTVWANEVKLGERPYGWISFSYDVSEVVQNSDTLTIAVRVDNEQQPAARWYTGSGIYGHTWIAVREKVHVPGSGVFVRTEGNSVSIDTEIRNASEHESTAYLKTIVKDPSGQVIGSDEKKLQLAAGELGTVEQRLDFGETARWSVESPNLYSVVSTLKVEDREYESASTRFGFRDVEWKPETGMWVDGENIKLRGVCNHQDAGALGAAVPDKILRFRIEQLKAMGVNCIRVSHNPQTPIFYELCDEIGMFVMDEIFDGWNKKAEHDYGRYSFDEWWRRDVTDWIKRDRSHPSIIVWSVGNETHGEVAKDLVALCNELDPTRPVTSGSSENHDMDLFGVNGGSESKGYFERFRKGRDYGRVAFVGTENPHTWHVRGYYRTQSWFRDGYPNPKRGPHEIPDLTEEEIFTYDWTEEINKSSHKQIFNSSYDNATVRLNARQAIAQLRDIPFYAGSFRWTGHDYLGEAGFVHGGWPFKAFMGGVIDLANFEKDHYYLYQSQWTDEPMLHLLPHWTHPVMEEGTQIPVWAYTNCDSVELFLNGKSLGKRTPGETWDEMQCQWMVGWQRGELRAVAYKGGEAVLEKVVRSAGAPAKNALSIDGEALAESGKDWVQVRVATQDLDGNFYPYGENRTYFHVMGPAEIDALDNGSPMDVEPHHGQNNRIGFFGLTRAYVKSKGSEGAVILLAGAILGEKKLITSRKVHIDTQLLALRGALVRPMIEVYYTLDGSEPTAESTLYKGGFDVSLGTTVRALVMIDGEPTLEMEERFANDVGFVWTSGESKRGPIGEQAEDAWVFEAEVLSSGKNFNGAGYVDLGEAESAYVEWYQENDGAAGEYILKIRSSAFNPNDGRCNLQVTVNGVRVPHRVFVNNVETLGEDWQTVSLEVKLNRGANYIRVASAGLGQVLLDEIVLK